MPRPSVPQASGLPPWLVGVPVAWAWAAAPWLPWHEGPRLLPASLVAPSARRSLSATGPSGPPAVPGWSARLVRVATTRPEADRALQPPRRAGSRPVPRPGSNLRCTASPASGGTAGNPARRDPCRGPPWWYLPGGKAPPPLAVPTARRMEVRPTAGRQWPGCGPASALPGGTHWASRPRACHAAGTVPGVGSRARCPAVHRECCSGLASALLRRSGRRGPSGQ